MPPEYKKGTGSCTDGYLWNVFKPHFANINLILVSCIRSASPDCCCHGGRIGANCCLLSLAMPLSYCSDHNIFFKNLKSAFISAFISWSKATFGLAVIFHMRKKWKMWPYFFCFVCCCFIVVCKMWKVSHISLVFGICSTTDSSSQSFFGKFAAP